MKRLGAASGWCGAASGASVQPLGGAVSRGYVEPSRSVDSLRELAQLSFVGLLADSLLCNGMCYRISRRLPGQIRACGSVWSGRCRAQIPAGEGARVASQGWCCQAATLPRDMSQPSVTPGRHASVCGQHEACRHNSVSAALWQMRSSCVMQHPHLAHGPDVCMYGLAMWGLVRSARLASWVVCV